MTVSALLLAASIVAAPAAAQTDQPLPVRAADAIAANGYYQSPSAEVDGDALATMVSGHSGFGFVVLSDEPIGASIEFADDVLDAAQSRAPLVHTVVVVSPVDYGAVSERYSDDAVDAAFEDVVDTLRTDRVAGLDDFADRVPSAGPTLTDDTDEDDGSSFPIGWVLLLVALVGGSFLLKALGLGGSSDGYSDGDSYESGSSRRSWSSRRSFSSRRSSSSGSSRRSSSSRSSSRRGRGGGRF